MQEPIAAPVFVVRMLPLMKVSVVLAPLRRTTADRRIPELSAVAVSVVWQRQQTSLSELLVAVRPMPAA